MREKLFTIGPFTVYGYGLMIAVGVLAAYWTADYRGKKKGLDTDFVFSLALICAVGGIAGAKLMYYITMIKEIMKNPSILLNISEGFVVYGGIITGILVGLLYSRKKKVPFLPYFDLVMPSVALAQGFGRIGCLFAGCCYGLSTDSPFCIIFPENSSAPGGIPLIPTQIISSGLNFIHFFILIWFAKRNKKDGRVAALYLILYSAGRFVLEFFRGDLIRGSVGVLSTSQFISVFVIIFAAAWMIYLSKKEQSGE